MKKQFKLTTEQQETIDEAIKLGLSPADITDDIKQIIAETGTYPMLIRSVFQGIGVVSCFKD
ncbi:MAG: hypothetical protein LBT79_02005 [Elusimicrobiota bacterium]|jgi:hypothetical protein|nr:hypothetical protein [Elusimicrobiota bacterium]